MMVTIFYRLSANFKEVRDRLQIHLVMLNEFKRIGFDDDFKGNRS